MPNIRDDKTCSMQGKNRPFQFRKKPTVPVKSLAVTLKLSFTCHHQKVTKYLLHNSKERMFPRLLSWGVIDVGECKLFYISALKGG